MRKCLLLAFCLAAPAAAQTVTDCDGWQSSARNLVEPWQANTRTFANGAIRVALLDVVEPAAGAFYLMVLTPPYDELGGRSCALVAEGDGGTGFAGIEFAAMQAGYDPARGLTLSLPVTRFDPESGGFSPRLLAVTINQATGLVTADAR